jgi:FkbM family methyltransferase
MAAIQPGDGCLDIGANVGDITLKLAKQVGPQGHVLAVEPDPESARDCRERMRDCPWAEVIEFAVSDRSGDTLLHQDKAHTRHSLWKLNVLEDAAATLTVRTTTLDALAKAVRRLRAIKIDAQGAEVKILEGGQDTLRCKGLLWKVEFWPEGLRHAGSSIEALADMFAVHGYRPWESTWARELAEMAEMKGHSARDVVILQ